jgi:hypothetical protein
VVAGPEVAMAGSLGPSGSVRLPLLPLFRAEFSGFISKFYFKNSKKFEFLTQKSRRAPFSEIGVGAPNTPFYTCDNVRIITKYRNSYTVIIKDLLSNFWWCAGSCGESKMA